jgi:hypothetical protein
MKQIYIGITFCICFLLNFSNASAQETKTLAWENDTIDNKVEVAFRSINQRDLLGGGLCHRCRGDDKKSIYHIQS